MVPTPGRMEGKPVEPMRRWATWSLALCLPLLACGGESGFTGPGDGGDDGDDLRPGLTVQVEAGPEAASIAEALGWTDGIPGAEVRIHRLTTDFSWQTALTDATGTARFPDAITGTYRVAAFRELSAAEAATLGGPQRTLGSGRAVGLSMRASSTLRLQPNVTGGLVISEVYGTAPFVDETTYDFHYFLELYNNSAETVFLDRKLVGTTFPMPDRSSSLVPCDLSEDFRRDPNGLWVRFVHQFPGSGTEHPLGPGETAVVALDAFDHASIADPRMPDLSDADFEFIGDRDADNPAVPNLPEVGLQPWFQGHGLSFLVSHNLFIAEPVDLESLPRRVFRDPRVDIEFMRIPATAIIDVLATESNNAFSEQQFPECHPHVPRDFDRLEGGFIKHGEDLEFSVQRRVLNVVDGRKILQDTNTSAVDLVRARFTPGTQLDR